MMSNKIESVNIMAETINQSIKCTKCQKEGTFIAYKSINRQEDEKEAKLLLDGSIFRYICPHCGNVMKVTYPLLYNDMKNKVMIQLVSEKDIDNAVKMFDTIRQSVVSSPIGDYRYRIVTSSIDMCEKALLFEAGFNDEVAELVKLSCMGEHCKNYPDDDIKKAYFVAHEGELYLRLFAAEEHGYRVNKELYNDYKNLFESIYKETNKEYVIDFKWAMNVMNSMVEVDN